MIMDIRHGWMSPPGCCFFCFFIAFTRDTLWPGTNGRRRSPGTIHYQKKNQSIKSVARLSPDLWSRLHVRTASVNSFNGREASHLDVRFRSDRCPIRLKPRFGFFCCFFREGGWELPPPFSWLGWWRAPTLAGGSSSSLCCAGASGARGRCRSRPPTVNFLPPAQTLEHPWREFHHPSV